MANPITWRNVDAPHVDEAMRGMAWAGHSINSGFDNFTNALKQNEVNNQAVWQQGKDANTAAYLDELRKYRTPEELQAAQQGGALDALKQRFGQQMDLNRIGTETDNRVPLLQTRGKAAIDYATAQRNELYRPVREQAMLLAAEEDAIGLKLLEERNPGVPLADMYLKVNDVRRARLGEERAISAEQRAVDEQKIRNELAPLQRENLQATIEHSKVATDELRGTKAAATAKAESEKARAERLAVRAKVAEGGVFALDKWDSKVGSKAIDDHLNSKLVDPKDVPVIQEELGDLARNPVIGVDGKPLPIPTRVVLDAIRGMGARGYTGRWGNQISDTIRQRLADPKIQETIRKDEADLLNLDFTDATRPVSSTGTSTNELAPPAKEVSTQAIDSAAAKVAATTPPVTKEAADAAEAKAARKKLTDAFTAIQSDIRKTGGIDKATPEQEKELSRVKTAISALDEQEAQVRANLAKTLSESRRKADQEEARGKVWGR